MSSILYPVIKPVSAEVVGLAGRQKVRALSRFAREGAQVSAGKAGLPINRFEKDGEGVPLPCNGVFWSVTHKKDMVAGVVSQQSVGIDIESLKPVSASLFKRIVDSKESTCFKDSSLESIFFRTFTAKEAVLKKTGVGIRGLSSAKVVAVMDDRHLAVQYKSVKYWVENFYIDGYVAAVTKDRCRIEWTIE